MVEIAVLKVKANVQWLRIIEIVLEVVLLGYVNIEPGCEGCKWPLPLNYKLRVQIKLSFLSGKLVLYIATYFSGKVVGMPFNQRVLRIVIREKNQDFRRVLADLNLVVDIRNYVCNSITIY